MYRYGLAVLLCLAVMGPAQADMAHDKIMIELNQMAKAGKSAEFLDIVKAKNLINKKDKDGHTPLFASLVGAPELAANLLKMGASLEQKDNNGSTPLMISAMLGNPEMVAELLRHGASIKTTNADGHSPLSIAALGMSVADGTVGDGRWLKVADALIKKGADVNHVDAKGGTALFYAVAAKDEKLCQLLVSSGANVNYALHGEIPLLLYAQENSSTAIVSLLKKAGAKL